MHDTATEITELPDSMWVVARRPKWIGMLVFALVVAALFAYLGHWQLDRSVQSLKPVNTGSETRKVLSDVTKPQSEFLDKLTGQKVSVEGTFDVRDFRVISDRLNYSKTGYWLVGRFVDDTNNASLAVALGWSPTAAGARSAISHVPTAPTVLDLGGRYLPTEDVDDGKFTSGEETVLAVPQLINEWNDFSGDAYNGYVVADRSWGSLEAIYSPPPIDKATLNWLNVFYAVEWVVFAGFAIFLWYRLVRDTYERELEEAEEAAALVGSDPASQPHRD
ncbi:MAG: hypothetical protein JWP75_3777 [Frondihabitans sp.]|nr:hypothetical protein [Frondihabitans sp.]